MTKCPVCKYVILEPSQLENNLPVLECKKCKGSWIRANEYAFWLKSQNPGSFDLPKIKEVSNRIPIVESNKAAICPDCGHFLRKYKIGSNVNFHLDRCNNCNGVWLDHNEWQSLKMADLHDEINQIFTQPWQENIQKEITASKLDSLYLNQFGGDDYTRIKEIRGWLRENPNRSTLLAFLLDENPYSS